MTSTRNIGSISFLDPMVQESYDVIQALSNIIRKLKLKNLPSSENLLSSENLPSSENLLSSENLPSSENHLSSKNLPSSENQLSSKDKLLYESILVLFKVRNHTEIVYTKNKKSIDIDMLIVNIAYKLDYIHFLIPSIQAGNSIHVIQEYNTYVNILISKLNNNIISKTTINKYLTESIEIDTYQNLLKNIQCFVKPYFKTNIKIFLGKQPRISCVPLSSSTNEKPQLISFFDPSIKDTLNLISKLAESIRNIHNNKKQSMSDVCLYDSITLLFTLNKSTLIMICRLNDIIYKLKHIIFSKLNLYIETSKLLKTYNILVHYLSHQINFINLEHIEVPLYIVKNTILEYRELLCNMHIFVGPVKDFTMKKINVKRSEKITIVDITLVNNEINIAKTSKVIDLLIKTTVTKKIFNSKKEQPLTNYDGTPLLVLYPNNIFFTLEKTYSFLFSSIGEFFQMLIFSIQNVSYNDLIGINTYQSKKNVCQLMNGLGQQKFFKYDISSFCYFEFSIDLKLCHGNHNCTLNTNDPLIKYLLSKISINSNIYSFIDVKKSRCLYDIFIEIVHKKIIYTIEAARKMKKCPLISFYCYDCKHNNWYLKNIIKELHTQLTFPYIFCFQCNSKICTRCCKSLTICDCHIHPNAIVKRADILDDLTYNCFDAEPIDEHVAEQLNDPESNDEHVAEQLNDPEAIDEQAPKSVDIPIEEIIGNEFCTCPNCKAPIERTSGCNHMTCGGEGFGCKIHFCFLCNEEYERNSINNHYIVSSTDTDTPPIYSTFCHGLKRIYNKLKSEGNEDKLIAFRIKHKLTKTIQFINEDSLVPIVIATDNPTKNMFNNFIHTHFLSMLDTLSIKCLECGKRVQHSKNKNIKHIVCSNPKCQNCMCWHCSKVFNKSLNPTRLHTHFKDKKSIYCINRGIFNINYANHNDFKRDNVAEAELFLNYHDDEHEKQLLIQLLDFILVTFVSQQDQDVREIEYENMQRKLQEQERKEYIYLDEIEQLNDEREQKYDEREQKVDERGRKVDERERENDECEQEHYERERAQIEYVINQYKYPQAYAQQQEHVREREASARERKERAREREVRAREREERAREREERERDREERAQQRKQRCERRHEVHEQEIEQRREQNSERKRITLKLLHIKQRIEQRIEQRQRQEWNHEQRLEPRIIEQELMQIQEQILQRAQDLYHRRENQELEQIAHQRKQQLLFMEQNNSVKRAEALEQKRVKIEQKLCDLNDLNLNDLNKKDENKNDLNKNDLKKNGKNKNDLNKNDKNDLKKNDLNKLSENKLSKNDKNKLNKKELHKNDLTELKELKHLNKNEMNELNKKKLNKNDLH